MFFLLFFSLSLFVSFKISYKVHLNVLHYYSISSIQCGISSIRFIYMIQDHVFTQTSNINYVYMGNIGL